MSLFKCSGINISFFVSYLLNFCYFPSVILLRHLPWLVCVFCVLCKIVNMFCTLFYCYHHWLGNINASGSVHSSQLILFFLSLNSRLRYITITVTGFHSVKNIYNYSKKIWDKLWFLCEIVPYGIGPISFFQYFLASIENIFILALRLGTSLSF